MGGNLSLDPKFDEKRIRLKEIIKERGIIIKDVTLSSNKKSHFYYDIKSIVSDPEGAILIGELMFTEIQRIEPKTRAVGGLELGAIAIATTIVCSSYPLESKNSVSGFFVRKSVKTYGLEKRIEGIVQDPVVVVDDVITTGNSVLEAVTALRSQRINTVNIMCVIDRQSNENLLIENNLKFYSLFKHSEFADYINSKLESNIKNIK